MAKQKESHDIEIEVVDNGFVATVGAKTFVFSGLSQLDDWIKKNFNTPKNAKKTVKKANGLTETQDKLIDEFEKINIPGLPNVPAVPFSPGPPPYNQPYKVWDDDHYTTDGTSITPEITYTSHTHEKKGVK